MSEHLPARDRFSHCPECGAAGLAASQPRTFDCNRCGFRYHHNTAAAAGGFLLDPAGRLLVIVRAHDPGRGLLDVPGGFLEAGESAEEALIREVHEELGVDIRSPEYLCSQPNQYPYRGIVYDVLDLFFVVRDVPLDGLVASDEIASWRVVDSSLVDPAEFAFPSTRAACRELKVRLAR